MQFRTGRTVKIERDRLLEASGLSGPTLDRLAAALSVAAGPDAPPAPDDPEGRGSLHDPERIDDFAGTSVLRPVLAGPTREEFVPRLRAHLERGYDLLYSAFERAGTDWEQTLVCIAPDRSPAGVRAQAGARPIEVPVGTDRLGRPILWRINQEAGRQTNANVRLAGMPGVGKSQVLLHLLATVAERSEAGFILLDYKGDLSTNTDFLKASGATVIRAGESPIPVNPFQLPDDVNRTLAPRAFAELFETVEPKLGWVQKRLVTEAMERAYERVTDRTYPTLAAVAAAIVEIYAENERPPDSVVAALRDLTSYRLFAEVSERSLEDLFSVRWVVDLAGLQALRDLVAFVFLEFLHQAARGQPDSDFDPAGEVRRLRGIVAVDEAHYYLRRRCQPLLDLIRIGRSKGVPVFLSSQSLEDFRKHTELNEFLPNTFVFKHGVAPDRRVLAGALGLGTSEAEQIADRVTHLEKFAGYATIARDGGLQPVHLCGFWERACNHSSKEAQRC